MTSSDPSASLYLSAVLRSAGTAARRLTPLGNGGQERFFNTLCQMELYAHVLPGGASGCIQFGEIAHGATGDRAVVIFTARDAANASKPSDLAVQSMQGLLLLTLLQDCDLLIDPDGEERLLYAGTIAALLHGETPPPVRVPFSAFDRVIVTPPIDHVEALVGALRPALNVDTGGIEIRLSQISRAQDACESYLLVTIVMGDGEQPGDVYLGGEFAKNAEQIVRAPVVVHRITAAAAHTHPSRSGLLIPLRK